MLGERLSQLLDFEQQKLAAGVLLLSPFLPLLFMGEEYGETAPFQYFVSHTDPGLIAAVREGRAREFAAFAWKGDVPDPQAADTFERSRPDGSSRNQGRHGILLRFYQELIRLRKRIHGLYDPQRRCAIVTVLDEQGVLAMPLEDDRMLLLFHFGPAPVQVTVAARNGNWEKVLESADSQWSGPGSQVPARRQSNGKIHLDLSPNSILVLQSIK
jgi:maltooligosyltrehalose trehalohydrolase